MKLVRTIAGCLAATLGAVPLWAQAADEPLRMAPSTNWVMDYATESCVLRRAFQAGDEQAILELTQFGPGDSFQVAVTSATLSQSRRAPQVRFEPDEDSYEPLASFFIDDGETHGVLYTDSLRSTALKRDNGIAPDWPEAERDARERSITALSVTRTFGQSLSLQTGSMHPPMEAMRTCLDELLAHWGLDADTQRTLSRPAKPANLEDWARRVQAAYPSDMIRRGRSGVLHIRLIVGAGGNPTECIPYEDYSTPGFDEQACKITLRHARFEPALDANGVAVPSFYTTTISYQVFGR